jgi:hypothetical protein
MALIFTALAGCTKQKWPLVGKVPRRPTLQGEFPRGVASGGTMVVVQIEAWDMATHTATAARVRSGPKATEAAPRSSFFFWSSAVLLSFLAIGFAPTLYLRAFFDVPPIPGYLYVHGGVLTAWFIWLAVQTTMVRMGRTALHRRFGVIGAIIAAAVIGAGLMATRGFVARLRAHGIDWDTDMSAVPALGIEGVPMVQFAAGVFWGNVVGIAVFAGLVVAAILLRHKPQAHKRLMLLASIALIGPALARISRWSVFGGEDSFFVPIVFLGLLAVLIAYDVISARRLHTATLIGCGGIVLALIASELIADSGYGLAVVRMIG